MKPLCILSVPEPTVMFLYKGYNMNKQGGTSVHYAIKMLWDEKAAVWIAASPDVPGLVLESESFDALVKRVRYAVPELLELNGEKTDALNLTFFTERQDKAAVYG